MAACATIAMFKEEDDWHIKLGKHASCKNDE